VDIVYQRSHTRGPRTSGKLRFLKKYEANWPIICIEFEIPGLYDQVCTLQNFQSKL